MVDFEAFQELVKKERAALPEKFVATDDIDQYRGEQGEHYKRPTKSGGATDIQILPELIGLPICNLILAHLHGCNPIAIRITTGDETTDSMPGRITIHVDENDRIKSIEQQVNVLYACGRDIWVARKALAQAKDLEDAKQRIEAAIKD